MEEQTTQCSVMWTLVYALLGAIFLLIGAVVSLKLMIRCRRGTMLRRWGLDEMSVRPVVVGFFHPYCHAGGGGERVLWQAIKALQDRYSFVRCVIYTGLGDKKDNSSSQILNKVRDQFGIALRTDEVMFVRLYRLKWVEPGTWPRFTILGQSLGSVVLGLEALFKFSPHVFMETTGYAFVVPLFRWLGGCNTLSYVHYPTVSHDMLQKVRECRSSFNNSDDISRSKVRTNLKLIYYRLFAKLYGFVGRRNHVVMVNSTWTHGHISKIWGPSKLYIVYPPCDTATFQQLPLRRGSNNDKFLIVSIGQFRPEKNHELQLHILAEFLKRLKEEKGKEKEHRRRRVELVMVGSCRNSTDYALVQDLKRQVKSLKLNSHVRFELNVSFQRLKEELGMASVALHTMSDEHFGIGLVECMAAGCVMIGHRSGGPQMDIVTEWKGQRTGMLAASLEHYVMCLLEVFRMRGEERDLLVSFAREAVRSKFSVEVFEASFLRATEHLFT